MNIITVMNPTFTFNPLLAKNLTYAFGHIFVNSTIYMAVIGVYEILSRQTKRPWPSNKPFLIAWTMSTTFTLLVYPHHLLMDGVMPKWMLIMGKRSEEHTSELQSRFELVCRLLLEKKKSVMR